MMRPVLALRRWMREERAMPLWGWILPGTLVSLLVLSDTLYFMHFHSAILPAADFASALYDIGLLILALSFLAVRYFRIGLRADLIIMLALWASMLDTAYIAALSNLAIVNASNGELAYAVSELRVIGFLIPGLIFVAVRGRLKVGRYSLFLTTILFAITSSATALMVLYFAGELPFLNPHSASAYSYPLAAIGMLASMFVAAGIAGTFLSKAGRRIFENSFKGLVLFLAFGLTGSLLNSFHPAYYSYVWYLAKIFAVQAYFFIVWGLLLDFAISRKRGDALSLATSDLANQLMQSTASKEARLLNHHVVNVIHSAFGAGESFSYFSKNGNWWQLESNMRGSLRNVPELPTEFSAKLDRMKIMDRELFFTQFGADSSHIQLTDIMKTTFLAGVCTSANGTYHLVGIREKNRIAWFEEEKTFIEGAVAIFGAAITEREAVMKESESISRLLALMTTGRLLERVGDGQLNAACSDTVDAVIGLLHYEHASIWLPDENNKLRLAASNRNKQIEETGGVTELNFQEGIIGRAASCLAPVLANDITREPVYINLYGEEIGSEFAVPAVLDGRVAVVIDVHSSYANYFQEIDIKVMNSIANMLCSIIRNNLVYSSISDGRKLAETRMHLISHDIGNILQAISANVKLIKLKGRKRSETFKQCIENLDAISSGALVAWDFLSDISNILRLETGSADIQKEVEVVPLIEKVKEGIRCIFPEKRVICHIVENGAGCSYSVNASVLIAGVFFNLFSNSIKYSNGDSVEVWIELSRNETGGRSWISIDFSDNGVGIDPGKMPEVFKRINKSVSVAGHSLSLIKQVIESSGGSIEVRERVKGDYKKGTTFSIRLIPSDSANDILNVNTGARSDNSNLL